MTLTHLSISDLKTLCDIAFKFSTEIREQYDYWEKVQRDCEQEICNRIVGIWGSPNEVKSKQQ